MSMRALSAGSALITAIFLIVVLAAIGAAMTSLTTVQQDTANKALLAARVYYGAKAGLEWAVHRTITDAAPPANCAASSTFSPAGSGLANVSVTVTCASSQHGTGTTSFVYYITSVATTGTLGTLSYAERRMEATVSNIP
jgi:MSHA biogenesis protein MshP